MTIAPRRILTALTAATAVLTLGVAAVAHAHTEVDFVAVPATGSTTLTLRPTHGCGDSPTVEVAIQAPVEGATAGEVAGWTATSTADGKGNTVLEWTGGSLPSNEHGAFPVTFTVPDRTGELLVFPAVQTCENGEVLSWIDGDPAAEYPAPRLLVLPAGSEPAASIDEVAPDAPGRNLLESVVDVDNPAATTSEPEITSEPETTSAPETTSEPETTSTGSSVVTSDNQADEPASDDGDNSAVIPVLIGVVVIAAIGIAVVVVRSRGGSPTPQS